MFAAALRAGYEPLPAFEPKARIIYAIIAVEVAIALVVFPVVGLRFADMSPAVPSISAAVIVFSAWASRRAGLPSVATWLEATALAYISGIAGWGLCFLVTLWALPYGDWWLSAADKVLGFDFAALYHATRSWPWSPIYRSFNWQPALVVLALATTKRDPWPLVLAMNIALLITIVIYPFATAIGPIGFYHLGPPGAWTPTIEALRDHGVRTIRPDMFVGMISLPSFHASVGVFIIWAMWPFRLLRWPFLALNGAMILSTIPFGEHYLVDVIGGVAVAFVAIVGAQRYYGK